MFVYNLEKLNQDGFKQVATDITHVRLYYDDFTGSNYVQGTFRTGSTSIVQFNTAGVQFTLFKMFTSTDGISYTERESFGGDNGTTLIDTSLILDPNDYSDALPYPKYSLVDGVKMFVPGAGGSGTAVGTGVDYLYCRGRLVQHNSLRSGKLYFGSYAINADTGVYETPGTISPELSIADSWSLSGSGKVSTGIYGLQFKVGTTNKFVDAISHGTGNSYVFEQSVYHIWRKVTSTLNTNEPDPLNHFYENILTNELVGTMVLCVDSTEYGGGFSQGVLVVKTYDPDGVLADNILAAGITVEFRAFPNLYLG